MGRRIYKTYEITDEYEVPICYGICRVDEAPLLQPGQKLNWLIGKNLPISEFLARDVVRFLPRLMADYCGDREQQPNFLRTHMPTPPRRRGRGHGRPVARIWPDGREEHFSSVSCAAKAAGFHRPSIERCLMDGRADQAGNRWRDVDESGGIIELPVIEKLKKSSESPFA